MGGFYNAIGTRWRAPIEENDDVADMRRSSEHDVPLTTEHDQRTLRAEAARREMGDDLAVSTRDCDQRIAEAVKAERDRIVNALRGQAECYPRGSAFAYVGDSYRSAADFIEALERVSAS